MTHDLIPLNLGPLQVSKHTEDALQSLACTAPLYKVSYPGFVNS